MPAVTYQSSQTADGTTSVVVTKPTSLAVGDLMLGQVAARDNSGGSVSITPPSGWSVLTTESDSGNGIRFETYYKVATSGDVAASNFTWTATGAEGMVGAISRFTNPSSTTPIDQSQDSLGSGAGYTSLSGITPTKAAGTMVIFAFYLATTSGTTSTYAIATNNPTWTEAYDLNINPDVNARVGISMAYAHRPELTATGSVSAVASVGLTRSTLAIVNLPAEDLTFASVTTTAFGAGIRTVIDQIATVTSSLLAPTVTEIENIWSNVSKNVSSWVNQSKT